jgi:hypothetical protein
MDKGMTIEQLKKESDYIQKFMAFGEFKINEVLVDTQIAAEIRRYLFSMISERKHELTKMIEKFENPNRKIVICIEAEWSGYRSSQARIVHREYRSIKASDLPKYQNIRSHRFDDNTANYHRVTVVRKKGELGQEIRGYNKIVEECLKPEQGE